MARRANVTMKHSFSFMVAEVRRKAYDWPGTRRRFVGRGSSELELKGMLPNRLSASGKRVGAPGAALKATNSSPNTTHFGFSAVGAEPIDATGVS